MLSDLVWKDCHHLEVIVVIVMMLFLWSEMAGEILMACSLLTVAEGDGDGEEEVVWERFQMSSG